MPHSRLSKFVHLGVNHRGVTLPGWVRKEGRILFFVDDLLYRVLKETEDPAADSDKILGEEVRNPTGVEVRYDWEENVGFLKTE